MTISFLGLQKGREAYNMNDGYGYEEDIYRFLQSFLSRSGSIYVVIIVFIIVALAVNRSLKFVRKDFGEITREPSWSKIPGIIAGVLFSIFSLVFMLHRTQRIAVAVVCAISTLILFVAAFFLSYFRTQTSEAQKDSMVGTAMPSNFRSRIGRFLFNPVYPYVLNMLSALAFFAFIFYPIVYIIVNVFIVYMQIHEYHYTYLFEALRLWGILLTAISSIAVVVFSTRLLIEIITTSDESGNKTVSIIKKRLQQ